MKLAAMCGAHYAYSRSRDNESCRMNIFMDVEIHSLYVIPMPMSDTEFTSQYVPMILDSIQRLNGQEFRGNRLELMKQKIKLFLFACQSALRLARHINNSRWSGNNGSWKPDLQLMTIFECAVMLVSWTEAHLYNLVQTGNCPEYDSAVSAVFHHPTPIAIYYGEDTPEHKVLSLIHI